MLTEERVIAVLLHDSLIQMLIVGDRERFVYH